jgi:hypothetical protein
MIVRKTVFLKIAVLFLIGLSVQNAQSNIIHVPGQVPTIKAGIGAAQEGDTVMVSAGTHTGSGNRDVDFGGKAIVVRSMKGAILTTIDCKGDQMIPHRGFHAHQGEGPNTIIQGFTIINGYAPFDGPGGEAVGGGILCENGSSPTIQDCIFYGNYAARAGGGLCCLDSSAPIVSNCTFVDNTAISDTAIFIEGFGGAIRCQSSSPIFRNCIIASNRANIGGGMSCNDSDPTLENCEFSHNTADVIITFEPFAPGVGGGLHLYNSSPTLDYCVFDRNIAINGQNMSYENAAGGGLACYNSSPVLTNCTLYGNTAEKYGESLPGLGAGIFLFDSPARIENSIIAYNMGGKGVGCPFDHCSDTLMMPTFVCTDIVGNELGDWTDSIAGQEGIDGNFSSHPFFCDPLVGNLNLWSSSPCTVDNSECGILIGAYDIGCLTDANNPGGIRPETYRLSQNRPNPFNQSTIIEYALSTSSIVSITVYNSLGQIVNSLVDSYRPAGSYSVFWDGKDLSGNDVASGVYFYTLRADGLRETKRMVVIK